MVVQYRAKGPMWAKIAQVEADLNHLSTILHAKAWGALGGEPTLHKHLVQILRIARESKVADLIEVWTNGLRLRHMPPVFWSAVDVIVLSVYPGILNPTDLTWITDCCRDLGIGLTVKNEGTHPNFRTLFEPTPTDPEATQRKYDGCFFRRFSRVANDGYFYTCCCAPHMPILVQERPQGTDGVRISGLTEDGLRAYLHRTEPLGCCPLCAGRDTAQKITWGQERHPVKWLTASGMDRGVHPTQPA